MKRRNIILICLYLSFLSFSSKDQEEKLLAQSDEDNFKYGNLRGMEANEDEDPTPVGQSHYHKSSGGLSGGGVAGIAIAAAVVVIAAVVLAVVLKGVVVVGATAVGTTVATLGVGSLGSVGAVGTFGGLAPVMPPPPGMIAGMPGMPGVPGGPGMPGGGPQFGNSAQFGLNNEPSGQFSHYHHHGPF